MDADLNVQTAAVPGSDSESEPKSDWHAPVITYIDIKLTMDREGSGHDAVGKSGLS